MPLGRISTHAPRTGSDVEFRQQIYQLIDFNPRSPHGERQYVVSIQRPSLRFQPTLPARGATKLVQRWCKECDISTHAPRTGSDTHLTLKGHEYFAISTHAPRTGSDLPTCVAVSSATQFQPTLPARGATSAATADADRRTFQPTLPARGATVACIVKSRRSGYFNPRSPHGERLTDGEMLALHFIFQPTLPARGATIVSGR